MGIDFSENCEPLAKHQEVEKNIFLNLNPVFAVGWGMPYMPILTDCGVRFLDNFLFNDILNIGLIPMTELLKTAVAEVSKRTATQQNVIASLILAELADVI